MAQQILNLKISGLWTNPNGFSEVPPGSMAKAVNVVVDRESIIESRRGFKVYSNNLGETEVSTVFTFNNVVLALTEDNKLWKDDGLGAFTSYAGTYARPDANTKAKITKANKNLYFTTDNGIMKLTSVNSTPIQAGAPKALSGSASLSDASGWFDVNTSVAYRIVWGYKDANSNLILGAPSDRIVVSNTAGATRNVSITFITPEGVDETWFYQIYRSEMSVDLATPPSDDLQQVFEDNPTALEISNEVITVVDIVPETMKRASLYTNSTQEGIGNANWLPPFCKDLCTYKNYTFFANTRTVHRLSFNLISVGGTDGIQLGQTLTVSNGVTSLQLTADINEIPATGRFKLETSLTPAENVELTARSMVSVLNQMPSNTFLNAYYTSGEDELPGQFLFEKIDLSTAPFTVSSTNAGCWSPRMSSSIESANDTMPNRIYYSKLQQPEAVPLLNFIDVGSSNSPIERILPLRDGIIILKEDGIFRLSGDSPETFRVASIDSTVKILAPNTAVVLSNRVYFYSDQGVISASDAEAEVISRPIENLINFFSSAASYPNLYKEAFAISYESDHKYIMFMPSTGSDTYAKTAFVYNIFTNNWTQWELDVNCGIQNEYNNKVYLGCPFKDVDEGAHIKIERKDFTDTDYADIEFTMNLLNQTGDTVYFDEDPHFVQKIKPNDLIYQDGNRAKVITISEDFTYVTVEQIIVNDLEWTFSAGESIIYRPIPVSYQFNPTDAENPGIMKHFQRISYLVESNNYSNLEIRFGSDLSDESGLTEVILESKGTWGSGTWNEFIWGSGTSAVQRVDEIIPQTNQRANWLAITVSSNTVFNSAALSGISIIYNIQGERFK